MPFLSEKKKENGRTRERGSGPPAKNELVGHPIKKYHAPLEPIIWTVYGENGAGNAHLYLTYSLSGQAPGGWVGSVGSP
jgi:hypothetical protein